MELRESLVSLLLVTFLAASLYADSQPAKSPPEKCGDCHSDSPAFKEWQTSGHANALKTLLKAPNAGRNCLKCHSADYNRVRYNPWLSTRDLPAPEKAGNAISCSSCHKHGSKEKNNLIMPVKKLCTFCHVLYCGG